MGVIPSLFSQFGQAKKSEGTQSLAHLLSSKASYCHGSMRSLKTESQKKTAPERRFLIIVSTI